MNLKPEHLPVAVILSDLHFTDKPLWSSLPGCSGDSAYALTQNLKLAAQFNVPLVLAGDIFNQQTVTSQGILEFFKRVEEYPTVSIFFINGNHDRGAVSYCELGRLLSDSNRKGEWIRLQNDKVTEMETPAGKFKICGIDYRSTSHLPDALARVPKNIDFLVMHQTPKQFFSIAGIYDLDLEKDLPKNLASCRAFIFGDIHKPGVAGMNIEKSDDEVWKCGIDGQMWIMGGTPYVWRIDEAKYPHFSNLLTFNKAENALYFYRWEIDRRKYFIVNIDNEAARDSFPNFVSEVASAPLSFPPVYSIVYQEDIPRIKEVVEEALKKHGGFLFLHPQALTKMEKETLAIEDDESFSIERCLQALIASEFKEYESQGDLQGFCVSMLHAQNRDLVYDEFKERLCPVR